MTISNIIKIKELEEYILKEFTKCEEYAFGCYSCQTYKLLEDIKKFYEFCIDCEKEK